MDIKNIFVIGAGTMGNGIAQVAATSGYQVTCMDVQPAALEKAKVDDSKSSTKLARKRLDHRRTKSFRRRNSIRDQTWTHMKEADLVIEAATENPELKFKIFQDMDAQRSAKA